MKYEEYKIIMSRLAIETKVTESNLSEQISNKTVLHHEFLTYYIDESRRLQKYSIDLSKLYGEKYKNYKYKDDYKWDTKGEVDSQINSDKDYYKSKIQYENQKHIVEGLKRSLDLISGMSFSIRNLIDYLKLSNGGYI